MNLSAERVSVQSAALMMGINFTLIRVCLLGLPRRLYRRAEDRQTETESMQFTEITDYCIQRQTRLFGSPPLKYGCF